MKKGDLINCGYDFCMLHKSFEKFSKKLDASSEI